MTIAWDFSTISVVSAAPAPGSDRTSRQARKREHRFRRHFAKLPVRQRVQAHLEKRPVGTRLRCSEYQANQRRHTVKTTKPMTSRDHPPGSGSALSRIGEPAVHALVEALRDGQVAVRLEAARALERMTTSMLTFVVQSLGP
jgi:hypothetical protein